MVKYLDNVSDEEIIILNICIPLVYEFDAALKPIKHYYLGNADAIAQSWRPWPARARPKRAEPGRSVLTIPTAGPAPFTPMRSRARPAGSEVQL